MRFRLTVVNYPTDVLPAIRSPPRSSTPSSCASPTAWRRCSGAARDEATVVAARRVRARGRVARRRDAPAPRVEGRRHRRRAPRAARHARERRHAPRAVAARRRLPRAHPARREPASCRPTPSGTRSPALPPIAFGHEGAVHRAHERLRGKLSYSNVAFALAPERFTLRELAALYEAVLGYAVSPTNLGRVLGRDGLIAPTGATRAPAGTAGGRPAAEFAFTDRELVVSRPLAAFRPPAASSRDRSSTGAECVSAPTRDEVDAASRRDRAACRA